MIRFGNQMGDETLDVKDVRAETPRNQDLSDRIRSYKRTKEINRL